MQKKTRHLTVTRRRVNTVHLARLRFSLLMPSLQSALQMNMFYCHNNTGSLHDYGMNKQPPFHLYMVSAFLFRKRSLYYCS